MGWQGEETGEWFISLALNLYPSMGWIMQEIPTDCGKPGLQLQIDFR